MTLTPDTLVLTSPDALVSGLPYLLGFPPVESAVVLWLRDRRLLLTQRIDLPGDEAEVAPWLAAMWSHVAARECDELVIVMATARDDAADLAGHVRAVAAENSIGVRDALLLDDGRWRSLLCTDPECCDLAGRAIDAQVADRVAAEFTGAGVAPAAGRDVLVRELEATPKEIDCVSTAIAAIRPRRDRERWRNDVIAEFAAHMSSSDSTVDPAEVARLVRGLEDVRIRDTVLWEVSQVDSDGRFAALAWLAACARQTPEGHVAPIATCAAIAAWMVGDGARAQIALDRALRERPEYALAQLVQHSVRVGLPPSAWREAVSGLTRRECRHGRRGSGPRGARRDPEL